MDSLRRSLVYRHIHTHTHIESAQISLCRGRNMAPRISDRSALSTAQADASLTWSLMQIGQVAFQGG